MQHPQSPCTLLRRFFSVCLLVAITAIVSPAQTWLGTNGLSAWGDTQALLASGGFIIVGAQYGGVYRSPVDGPYYWNAANNGLELTDQFQITALVESKGFIFAGTNDGIYSSQDAAASWYKLNIGYNGNFIYGFMLSGDYLVAGTGAGILRSSDNGSTWTKANKGLADSSTIRAVVGSGGYLFVATIGGMYRSANYGTTWSKANKGLVDSTSIRSVASDENEVFAGTVNGLYRSTNNGDSWIKSNTGLGNQIARCFAIIGSEVFTGINAANGSNGGVLHSTNSGSSWATYGLSGRSVKSFAFSGDNLFAGSDNGNLNKLKLPPGTVGIKSSPVLLSMFARGRNLGSSAHSGSRIEFGIAERTLETLSIFDAKGNKMGTVANLPLTYSH